jgi:hypothetical protein
MTMRPIQSFGSSGGVRLLLCTRKEWKCRAMQRCARKEKKMSFIHLFLQRIECLSYIGTPMPLLSCFPRRKSLINSTKTGANHEFYYLDRRRRHTRMARKHGDAH